MTPSSEFTSKEAFPLDTLNAKVDTISERSVDLGHDDNGKKDTVTHGKENESEYPKFFPLLLITIALCLAVFCVSLGMFKIVQSPMVNQMNMSNICVSVKAFFTGQCRVMTLHLDS